MASREVFVDTSVLYALIDKRDSVHRAAREVVASLVQAGRRLVVSDYVVAESVNLANARGGSTVARRVLDLIEQSAGVRMEWIGTDRFELTKTYFRKHADHGYSFTDCTSFVLMRQLRLAEALTTDKHFVEAGFRSLLPA
ncbi:MAG: type II toxin-antitoxin system VapC family toxin [Steroidobacteraceae bacterium]|jgi:predicted nucleic acid-binding protein